LKVAVVGKGGVGKTFVAGTLARLSKMAGETVIAIDADPSTNLHFELGIDEDVVSSITPLCENRLLVRERTGADYDSPYPVFNLSPAVADIVERYAIDSPDGVKLLIMGTVKNPGEGCMCPANALLRALLRHVFVKLDATVVIDMEAGLEHLGRGTIEYVDSVLNILEPSTRSIETSMKIWHLASRLGIRKHLFIANKVAREDEGKFIEKSLAIDGHHLDLTIPYDENIKLLGMRHRAVVDSSKDSPALAAIEELRKKLYS